ncbi:MAG: hypothetical protein JXR96_22975 [Deltaproteobacteria bacterium]|nr:hypothetical protein [Deltaproteobacteria bacterium]
MKHLLAALACLATATALAGCGSALEDNCNASLDGTSIGEAKEILGAAMTYYYDDDLYIDDYEEDFVEFYAGKTSRDGSDYGEPPICQCFDRDGAVYACRVFGDSESSYRYRETFKID